ncbi:MAG: AAA family ATPase [Planctomycetota bacterium]
MAKVSLAEHLQDRPDPEQQEESQAGPYITISREFGCWGFSLGLLLLDILNEEADEGTSWKIYHKEVLDRLAEETNLDKEILEQQRRTKPRVIAEFFRSFGRKSERLPSGIEVRNRISDIIRDLATEGGAIVVGQGGAGATQGLPNGISVRLEAPKDWRVKQIAFREGLSETEARLRIQAEEREKDYLKKIYETRFPRKPAFNLVYDCSAFSLAQIAQHVVHAMKLKGIL